MGRYIIRRCLQAIPLLFFISIAMFIFIHLLPGGPEQVIFNPKMSAQARAALRAAFGLDQPLYIQYLKWLQSSLMGNFGFSFADFQPVSTTLASRFWATIELFSTALLLALVLAIPLGVISAMRQRTLTDYALTTLAYFGISMPIFLFALLAQYLFGVKLGWFPTSGTQSLAYTLDPVSAFVDHIWHLILPATVLSITFIAGWSRYMRSSMIETIKQDYMRTARAKGVPTTTLMTRHALRNAVIPLITVVALDFGQVAGGAAITETIFAWPGLGQLFLLSLDARDYPVLLAMLLLSAVFVVAFNLIADILYGVVDPRIRYA